MTATSTTTRDAALAAAGRGWHVFPLYDPRPHADALVCSCGELACASPGKHPRTRNGLSDATAALQLVDSLWGRYPNANIGIRTGAISGLLVLDVDPDHGGDDTLADLEREHGELPATVEALTGGGGRHVLFRHPGFEVRNTAGKLGAGLDTRGDGGYIVAAGSTHISGKRYEWSVDGHPDEVTLAPAPEWLLAILRQTPPRGSSLPGEKIPSGRRNETLFRRGCALRRAGFDRGEIEASLATMNAARCEPPMSDDEVATIAASAARYQPADDAEVSTTGTSAPVDTAGALAELTNLLALKPVGLSVTGARVVGRGGNASADIYLSDGSEIVFEHFKDIATPAKLIAEVAVCTGAQPALKAPLAIRCVALVRMIAAHIDALTTDDFARAWGLDYLQDATIVPLDMNDQADRWRAFRELESAGHAVTRDHPGMVALEHSNGDRFVRAGWFADAVRNHDPSVSHQAIGGLMLRVGWERRGKSGRIKATNADGRTLAWNFYRVPATWETAR